MPSTVWVKPLNDYWQPIGTAKDQGVWHEDLVCVSDQWGPKTATFTLRRQRRAALSDLLTETPMIVEEGGVQVWRGWVKTTPEQNGADRQVNVEAAGGQRHLDDGSLERILVHNDLTAYQDSRTLLAANLATLTQGWKVTTDNGAIVLGVDNGGVIGNGSVGGVTLDLGPASTARMVIINADSSNNAPAVQFRIRGSNSPDAATAGEDIGAFALNVGTPVSAGSAFTGTNAYRYIHLQLTAVGGFTAGADIYLRLKNVLAFADTAYQSSSASVLSAKMIIVDALTRATTLLHPDWSGIGDPAFSFPNFAPDQPRSARELISAANAPIGWRFKVDEQLRPIYQQLASVPVVDLGTWLGAEGDTGSSNSDEGIVTKVIVIGAGPDGLPVRSTRTQTGTIIDRQGGFRDKVLTTNFKLNSTFADKLGDAYLQSHQVSPFKGQNVVTLAGARRSDSGLAIRPAHMLLLTSELARRTDLVDPDRVALGRTAVIDQVTYRDSTQTAEIDLDNTRRDFEALQERLGLLVPS